MQPDGTTVGRWWRRYLSILEQTFVKIVDMLQLIGVKNKTKSAFRKRVVDLDVNLGTVKFSQPSQA